MTFVDILTKLKENDYNLDGDLQDEFQKFIQNQINIFPWSQLQPADRDKKRYDWTFTKISFVDDGSRKKPRDIKITFSSWVEIEDPAYCFDLDAHAVFYHDTGALVYFTDDSIHTSALETFCSLLANKEG